MVNVPLETEKTAAYLFPCKSQTKCENFYKQFIEWCTSKKIKTEEKEK